MEKTIIVYYNENGLIVYKEVADILKLHDGMQIRSEDKFWEIIGVNARYGLEKIKNMEAKQNV